MSPRLSPDHPAAPKYWAFETGGDLATAVIRYLEHPGQMSVRDIALMHAYLMQWFGSPVWDLNPSQSINSALELARLRKATAAIRTVLDIRNVLNTALDMGIDPL